MAARSGEPCTAKLLQVRRRRRQRQADAEVPQCHLPPHRLPKGIRAPQSQCACLAKYRMESTPIGVK